MASGAGTDGRVVAPVLVAGVAAVLVALAIGGTHAERRLAGSNGVASVEFVAVVGAGQVLCQTNENVPRGAGSLRLTVGTYDRPGPPLRTSVEDARGRRIAAGRLAGGWREGAVDVPLGTAAARGTPRARVCVANRGASRIAVGGAPLGRRAGARVAGRPARGRVRIEYIDGEPSSAWSRAGTVASRMGFARGVWGRLAPWVVLVLAALAAAGATRALLTAGSGGSEEAGAGAREHADAVGDDEAAAGARDGAAAGERDVARSQP